MSFKSDTWFLFRKVQVQAGCGSSSFIISFNEYFKILHFSASNCTASVTLTSSCFLNKCKTDGKRKPVHRVFPVQPHSIWSYFCLLYPNPFLTRISSILVMERWNTNCLYKAGETFVAVYQVLDVVFNFIKCWDCWVHAATSNSSLPFKYSQNCLCWQTSSHKEPSDLIQGGSLSSKGLLRHAPWASHRVRAWLPHQQGGGLGDASCSCTTVVLKGILPSLPSS